VGIQQPWRIMACCKSANAGDAEGQFLYAFTLAKGEGTARNLEEAYYWALKSGVSGVDEYDADREALRTGLEGQLDAATISRVKARL